MLVVFKVPYTPIIYFIYPEPSFKKSVHNAGGDIVHVIELEGASLC